MTDLFTGVSLVLLDPVAHLAGQGRTGADRLVREAEQTPTAAGTRGDTFTDGMHNEAAAVMAATVVALLTLTTDRPARTCR